MIDHDDMTTAPQEVPDEEPTVAGAVPGTIQIPAVQSSPAPQTPQAPAANPAMSIEDLLKLRMVSSPQVSPDGSAIAFVIQQSYADSNTTGSAIWLIPSRGDKMDEARQLTNLHGNFHDILPAWSPDGRMLAFLSDRGGAPQIYILSLLGGEARQVSNLSQGVTEYSWRPDGKALLAASPWKAEDDQHAPEHSDVAAVYTRLDEQWDGLGYKFGRRQQLWLIPLEGQAARLTSEAVDLVQPCWSPDGQEIVFCANRRPDPDLSASMALWVLNLASGQMRRLTPEDGLAQMPSWSPDGHTIAYYYTSDQTEAGNYSPWIVDARGTSAPRPATSTTNNYTCLEVIVDELHFTVLDQPQWYPDSQSLLITVQERGQVHLYHVDIHNDQVKALTNGNGCYLNPHLSRNGQTIATIRTDWFTPGDVWSMDGNGEHRHKLSSVNDSLLRSRQLVRPKRITWKSFDGLEIEGWLYMPAVAEGVKLPLILEVHGGPTLAWGDSYVHEFQVLAGKGYAVLAANPRGSAGYGEAFCRKVLNDWGGDDYHDLMAGIDSVLVGEAVDGNRLGIGGLSYGGYMTNWVITQTSRFRAAVSRNGVSFLPSMGLLTDQTLWFDLAMDGGGKDTDTFRRSCSALTFADHILTPLLLLHAENDLRCPYSESLQLFVMLRKLKRTVQLVRYLGVSHMMDWPEIGTPTQRVDRLRRTVEWFAHFV